MGYSFGKAQRILKGVDRTIGPIAVHGAVEPLNRAYRAAGVDIPETPLVTEITDKALFRRALIVAPPSVQGSVWTRRFGEHSDAFASGWMQLRGARRRRSIDRGFVSQRPRRLARAATRDQGDRRRAGHRHARL